MDSLHMGSMIGKIRWNDLDGMDKLFGVKMTKKKEGDRKKGLNVIKKNIKIDSECINDRRRRNTKVANLSLWK